MKWLENLLRTAAVAAVLFLPAALWAQSDVAQAASTQQQKDAQKQEPKKPHVWTNDDLPKATDGTVSVPSVAQPAPPASDQGQSAASATAAGRPPAGQAAPGAKPPVDVKAAEDKAKRAHEAVDNTKKTIQVLIDRIANETGARQQADIEMLQHAQQQLPGYQAQQDQAEKDLAAAQKAQPQGQQGQPGQPAPAPPPRL